MTQQRRTLWFNTMQISTLYSRAIGAAILLMVIALCISGQPSWACTEGAGQLIAFDSNGDIYVVSPTGGIPIKLNTFPNFTNRNAVLSNNGKQIAFVSNAHGGDDIYVTWIMHGRSEFTAREAVMPSSPQFRSYLLILG